MERDYKFLIMMDICNKISELLLEDDDEEDFDNEEEWEKMIDESYESAENLAYNNDDEM